MTLNFRPVVHRVEAPNDFSSDRAVVRSRPRGDLSSHKHILLYEQPVRSAVVSRRRPDIITAGHAATPVPVVHLNVISLIGIHGRKIVVICDAISAATDSDDPIRSKSSCTCICAEVVVIDSQATVSIAGKTVPGGQT